MTLWQEEKCLRSTVCFFAPLNKSLQLMLKGERAQEEKKDALERAEIRNSFLVFRSTTILEHTLTHVCPSFLSLFLYINWCGLQNNTKSKKEWLFAFCLAENLIYLTDDKFHRVKGMWKNFLLFATEISTTTCVHTIAEPNWSFVQTLCFVQLLPNEVKTHKNNLWNIFRWPKSN